MEQGINLERCADLIARMIEKYGPELLPELMELEKKVGTASDNKSA